MGPRMAVFGENGGRNLRFLFRDPIKASSPLQHSRTTVRACDLDSIGDVIYNCSSGDSGTGYTVYLEFLDCVTIDMSRLR